MMRLAFALVASVLVSCSSSVPPPEPRLEGTGTIAVTIEGFSNDEGQALICLFLSAKGFPDDPEAAFRAEKMTIKDGRSSIVFENVTAGPYAISAFHDEDADFELDTGLLGIPTEDWRVSRNAEGSFGPPDFADARLELAADERAEIKLNLKDD